MLSNEDAEKRKGPHFPELAKELFTYVHSKLRQVKFLELNFHGYSHFT